MGNAAGKNKGEEQNVGADKGERTSTNKSSYSDSSDSGSNDDSGSSDTSSGSSSNSGSGSSNSGSGSGSSSSSGSSDTSSKSGLEKMLSSATSKESSSSSSDDSTGNSDSSGSSDNVKKKGVWDNVFGSDSSSSGSSVSSVFKKTKDTIEPSDKEKGGKSFMKSVLGVLQGNTNLERVIFVGLVVIVFVILLSVGSNILSAILEPNNPFIVDGLYIASNGKVISQDPSKSDSIIIPRSDNESHGIEFSWSIWVNVTSLDDSNGNSGQYKHIFSKGDNDNVGIDSRGIRAPNNSPGLYIDKNTNSIVAIMNTYEQLEEMITVTDVPLNKWLHVLIRVEGVYFDVYVNGTLAKRKVLNSVPKQNNGNIYVCQNGGFSGFISNLRYFKHALEPGDISNIVNSGPSLKTSSLQKQYLKDGNLNYLAMDWYFQNAR